MLFPLIPLSMLLAHTIGDFSLQSDKMAVNKSMSSYWLTLHVLVYTLTMAVWAFLYGLSTPQLLAFTAVTFSTHYLTDFFTSRASRRLFPLVPCFTNPTIYYDNEGIGGRSRHRFFEMLGYDQLIHFFTLGYTLQWLTK